MRISITQARQRMADLGFEMNPPGACHRNWGRKPAEIFTHPGYHCLSVPFRDVFISKAVGGWVITSHIKFNARKFRSRLSNTFMLERKFICGWGATLKDAVQDFEVNYNLKIHGQR